MTKDAHHTASSSQTPTDNPLAQLLDEYLPGVQLERGQVIRGVVVRVGPGAIVVDVGAKCEGTVTGPELERLDPEFAAGLKPGDEVTAYVLNAEGSSGEVVLSLARAQLEADWEHARALLAGKEVVDLEVVSANRGGLIVQLGRLRGFIPASQLAASRGVPRISNPSCYEVLCQVVGQRLDVQVIEADRERNRLILSERAADAHAQRKDRVRFLASLSDGEVRAGRVSNLTDFGAFVNLGEVDGLVHLSEISWERVEHPSEVLRVGQEVEVVVLSVDRERQRVALSLKRLEPDPWSEVGERYAPGQLIQCRITRLTKWGAFACIVGDEAIEGLVHVSELDDGHVEHPREVVEPGMELTLRVMRVQPERHRLALSLRQVVQREPADLDWRAEQATQEPSVDSSVAAAFEEALKE